MQRLVLILPATTYRAGDFVDAATRLGGVEVVVASDVRQAMAEHMGPRALRVDLRQPEAAAAQIVEAARQAPVDAVVGVDDAGVVAAAHASERLGLAHNPVEAVLRTRDKARMRSAFARAGLRQPTFRVAGPHDDVAALAAEVGPPCVVKPVSLSASRGVIRVAHPAAAAAAAQRIRRILAAARAEVGGPLLVESYIPGMEVAVEGLLRGGKMEILAIFDKPDELTGPYFAETLYVTPSRLGDDVQADIRAATAQAAAALELAEGPVHAEFRLQDGKVWVLEVAARTIGGLCGRSLRFGLGMSLEEVVLRHALGLPLHALGREGAAAGVMMLPVPRAGVLERVDGVERARQVPGVEGVEITVAPGGCVQPLPEGERYLGFVFARGRAPEEVEASLRQATAMLDTRITDRRRAARR